MNSKIENMAYFAKGKRGIVYTAIYKKKKVAIKQKNPESKAEERIKNEANVLKLINKYGIGPKLIFSDNKNIVYEFINGDFIIDYIEKNNKKNILNILKKIFNQLYILDKLKINKEEMHHPIKHIIINKKNQPFLIDFERAYYSNKPHNVTQLCQFLINIRNILYKKRIIIDKNQIIKLAKNYKNKITKKNINLIKKYISK